MFDGEAFGQQMVEIVRGYVSAELAPLVERNAQLEARLAAVENREPVLPEKGDQGDPGPQGEPGSAGEVDMSAVKALIDVAVAALPPVIAEKGEPGRDVDMDLVEKRIDAVVQAAVAAIPAPQDGRDGVGLADALKDADGNLVLVMADGRTKTLGRVDGNDGADGETFTLDDFDIEQIDERSFKFGFTKGAVCHTFEFAFPVVLDRGVWATSKVYEKGDAVTWAGSLWIAQKDAPGKPDTADSGWRLAVKKGRDGKAVA